MFNIKRKVRQVVAVFEPTPDPQKLIAEIHEAFDSATDKLLAEAAILS